MPETRPSRKLILNPSVSDPSIANSQTAPPCRSSSGLPPTHRPWPNPPHPLHSRFTPNSEPPSWSAARSNSTTRKLSCPAPRRLSALRVRSPSRSEPPRARPRSPTTRQQLRLAPAPATRRRSRPRTSQPRKQQHTRNWCASCGLNAAPRRRRRERRGPATAWWTTKAASTRR